MNSGGWEGLNSPWRPGNTSAHKTYTEKLCFFSWTQISLCNKSKLSAKLTFPQKFAHVFQWMSNLSPSLGRRMLLNAAMSKQKLNPSYAPQAAAKHHPELGLPCKFTVKSTQNWCHPFPPPPVQLPAVQGARNAKPVFHRQAKELLWFPGQWQDHTLPVGNTPQTDAQLNITGVSGILWNPVLSGPPEPKPFVTTQQSSITCTGIAAPQTFPPK